MANSVILVTGADGQLGKSMQQIAPAYKKMDFVFLSRAGLPLDDPQKVKETFASLQPQYCINCAAYTAVDKAETEQQQAFLINAEAPGLLATLSKTYGTKFIHISTDYVFDGTSSTAYTEDTSLHPVNIYGTSKAKGEELVFENNNESIIIRTAWVYSEYGKNFVKTMMQLMQQKNELNIVNDQVGAPTYAVDLAEAIMHIINSEQWQPGIFHYANEGRISWFDFAVAIKELINSKCNLHGIPTSDYPTPAKRPAFSLLDTTKIKSVYDIAIPFWKDSLEKCVEKLERG